jgi:TRAP-type C4-dicarboxylate transport system substrate-binding protein
MKFAPIAAAFALAAGTAAAQTVWDMPTPYADATFHTKNIAEFSAAVSAKTNGALSFRVHSAGSLIKHPDIKNAVRGGQVPIGEFFLSLLANENPAFGIDSQPFLATTYEEAAKLWAAQRPAVERLFAQQGLTVLYAVPWPPQSLYTRKPINSVADLRGLKMRTNNPTLERLAALAGAAPTQVEVPDIPQAFATGRVEAMITSPTTGADSKAWDYVNTYTDIQAWFPKNIVVANTRALDRLPAEQKAAVLAAAAEAEARGWAMSKAETEKQIGVLKANGMTVVAPTPELMAGLKEIGAKMMEDWLKTAGEAGAAILAAYRQ